MTFEIREDRYEGNPVIEFLVDGMSWGEVYPTSEHFGFGITKSVMILTCMDAIESFVDSDGNLPATDVSTSYESSFCNECTVEKYDSFEWSNGHRINKPYLKLSSGGANKCFGMQKATALLENEEEIRQFVIRNSGNSPTRGGIAPAFDSLF